MAGLLRDSERQKARSTIVPIQRRGGRKMPLYCIGALSGEVLLFRRLALELGPDQPVIGLQPFRLCEESGRLLRVEEIAQHYLEEMKADGLQGPFALLGYSFGGLVALEMARLAETHTQKPAAVVMVDTSYLHACKVEEPIGERLRRYRHHVREGLQGGSGVRHLRSRVRESYRRMIQRRTLESGALTSEMHNTMDVQAAAMENYRAQPFGGTVHLFRAERRPEFFSGGETLGWKNVLPNLKLYDVPGDHGTMNTGPNVPILAKGVARCMEQGERAYSQSA
jgi:thioesterase domain-containing protein